MRASDRARDRTAVTLSRAAGEGRLSFDTLTWRLEGAFSAKDLDALDLLVCDLPWWRRPAATLLRDFKRWLVGADAVETPPPQVLRLPDGAGILVVGRGSTCDVRLSEQSTSRRHAQLRREGGGWRVVDLLSTNGTYLNGRRISSAVALPGDELTFGSQRVHLPR